MAAPQVAGAVALLKDIDETLSVDEIITALKNTDTQVSRAGRKRPRIALTHAEDKFEELWMRGPAKDTTLASGGDYTVSWFPQTGATKYGLYYSKNNGKSWTTVAENLTGTSYEWTVTTESKNRGSCRLSMKAFDGSGNVVGPKRAKSPYKFAVEVVKVTSQTSSVSYSPGNTVTITWDTHATTASVANTRIYYRKSSKSKWKLIEEVSGDPGTYAWTAPNLGSTKNKVRVKVDLRDASGKSLGNAKNTANFTLIGY